MNKPPPLAMWLLRHIGIDQSLLGDLLEEYDGGHSSGWFWRQTLAAVIRESRVLCRGMMPVVAAHAGFAGVVAMMCGFGLASAQSPSLPAVGRIVQADSVFGVGATMAIVLIVACYLFICPILLAWRQYRMAARMFFAAPAILVAYAGIVIIVSLASPATIVAIGDNYCYGDWCVGVRNVQILPDAAGRIVKVNVRIFSDANRGTRSAKGASLYVLDERNHRFPLVNDASTVPFDTVLAPRQLVITSLTFRVPEDSQHLFLTGDPASDRVDWRRNVLRLAYRPGQFLMHVTQRLTLGADFSLFHKHWALQVA